MPKSERIPSAMICECDGYGFVTNPVDELVADLGLGLLG
jgi:hypothetical protein